MDYTLTLHARTKIGQDQDLATAVLRAAAQPEVTYESRRGEGVSRRHVRNGITAVVNPDTGKIITFYTHKDETPLRPDQQSDPEAVASDIRRKAEKDRAAIMARKQARRERDRAFTHAQKIAGGKGK